MKTRIGLAVALATALWALAPLLHAQAYGGPASSAAAVRSLSEAELEQVAAPVALYPDALIANVLAAAAHPLEVVEADRWQKDHAANLPQGDDLAAALRDKPWDPSVKALVAIPRVLAMMDGDLQWTQTIGNAYLTQQAALMDAIQALRRRAEAQGSLQSTAQQNVVSDGQDIVIDPATADSIAVPYYDPAQVYGAWPWAAYPPVYFSPPFEFGFWGPVIAFDTVIFVGHHFHHHHVDWRRHRMATLAATGTAATGASRRWHAPAALPAGPAMTAGSAAGPAHRWAGAPANMAAPPHDTQHFESLPERNHAPWSQRRPEPPVFRERPLAAKAIAPPAAALLRMPPAFQPQRHARGFASAAPHVGDRSMAPAYVFSQARESFPAGLRRR